MPYIPSETRENLFGVAKQVALKCQSPGDLNYIITVMLHTILKNGMSYTAANELVGVLECAKMELYRRVVAPYEETKIAENGDIGILP